MIYIDPIYWIVAFHIAALAAVYYFTHQPKSQ